MKKILIPLLGIVSASFILSACGKAKDPADYVSTENFTVYDSPSLPETEMVNYDEITSDTGAVNFTYALNGTTVELLINDQIVNSLDFYYVPDTNAVKVADFDFDGFEDIFIPFEASVDSGCYYCYIPAKNDFVENQALNSIGKILTVSDENTLLEDRSDDTTKRTIEYKWNGNELEIQKKTEIYVSESDKKTHTDVYGYDENGLEFLISETAVSE